MFSHARSNRSIDAISVTPSSSERRSGLAEKARRLYGKYCGRNGRGICAESFAVYHLELGEVEVVEDQLAYLKTKLLELELADPLNRLNMTRELICRITHHHATYLARGSRD